jgi:hypothetical protein
MLLFLSFEDRIELSKNADIWAALAIICTRSRLCVPLRKSELHISWLEVQSTWNPWWKLCRKMADQQFRLTCRRASTCFFSLLMLYSDLIPLLVNTPGRPFWLMIHDLYILPILELLADCWFCKRPIRACHFIVVLCRKQPIICPSLWGSWNMLEHVDIYFNAVLDGTM